LLHHFLAIVALAFVVKALFKFSLASPAARPRIQLSVKFISNCSVTRPYQIRARLTIACDANSIVFFFFLEWEAVCPPLTIPGRGATTATGALTGYGSGCAKLPCLLLFID
jgi:hypothetical protein